MSEANFNLQTGSSRRRHFFIIVVVAALLVFLEVAGNLPNTTTPLERLELSARDTSFRLRGRGTPHPDIVIVAIDDDSLNWLGERWPWPRSRMAQIVDWLNEAGAQVIALDTFLFDPQPEGEDEALSAALEDTPYAITVNQIFETTSNNINKQSLSLPLPIYLRVLDGYGITEVERDDDAIVRSLNAYKTHLDDVYFNWVFEIARAYLDVEPPTDVSLASLRFNGQTVPLNQRGALLVDFAGPGRTYPTYSAAFVPLGDYPPETFAGKIVLIGATSETLQDLYPTPFSATNLTPGVEIVANAVGTILSGNYLVLAPPWTTLLLIVFMALASWFITRIPNPTVAIAGVLGGILIYFVARHIIFLQTGWGFNIVMPSAMLFLGVVLPTLEQAVTQEVEKRRVRGLFSRFISPEMVNQILETQDLSSLNKRTELTILFSDIRSFTTISERLTPEEVVALLNPYLHVMSEVIHRNGGTVDKYEGDAIVAFFGEPIHYPDHAKRAARAALEMRYELKKLTDGWRAEGRFNQTFEMGVGLNTGEVFVGLLGSEQRVNYTIIGDAANLAARLQDQTKEFNWPILISGETWEQIQDEFQADFAEAKLLKGKSEPVKIYKLQATKDGRLRVEMWDTQGIPMPTR
ncbi:MAG: adenylate/guanylate cyclase domain-containing protein [Anaerolineae bacterium]|nr:MAG: adenylate/guanylate cyclase domain-containing protein [Anaerolineae bacterium]